MSRIPWKHRKRSESDPFEILECGCKRYVYDGTIVRFCEIHNTERTSQWTAPTVTKTT